MSSAGRKKSSESSSSALDRWTSRRLHRLNTEASFREQRQNQSPATTTTTSAYASSSSYSAHDAASPASASSTGARESAPNASASAAYYAHHSRLAPSPSEYPSSPAPLAPFGSQRIALRDQHASDETSSTYASPRQRFLGYFHSRSVSPPPSQVDSPVQLDHPPVPHLSRDDSIGYWRNLPGNQPQGFLSPEFEAPSSTPSPMSNIGGGTGESSGQGSRPRGSAPGSGVPGSNRQSMHNGMNGRDASTTAAHNGAQGAQGQYNGTANPSAKAPADPTARGSTPQPIQAGDDMSPDEVKQLVKEHKELREKYTKVKKFYFERDDQVKHLQNSLAHHRISQSRTSLDDTEYMKRFDRLEGLITQLAFGIRKNWRTLPAWLGSSVNKDAIATGKQEMIAVGRAVVSSWLAEEVFHKYFHPDLELSLSMQLRALQRNIRRCSPVPQIPEEEELLTSKITLWRLTTLDGLQEALRSPQCAVNRAQLTQALKDQLCTLLTTYLHEPAPPELEGGVHVIIELALSIAIHLPLESRDVVIEYFSPGDPISQESMRIEAGIQSLGVSVADEANERASERSVSSEHGGEADADNAPPARKRSMLAALTSAAGVGLPKPKIPVSSRSAPQDKVAAESPASATRPDAAGEGREVGPQRVRIAAGVAVRIRGKQVLLKAPVFPTG